MYYSECSPELREKWGGGVGQKNTPGGNSILSLSLNTSFCQEPHPRNSLLGRVPHVKKGGKTKGLSYLALINSLHDKFAAK